MALSQIATVDRCVDGDVFVHGDVGRQITLDVGTAEPVAGAKVAIPGPSARPPWSAPTRRTSTAAC